MTYQVKHILLLLFLFIGITAFAQEKLTFRVVGFDPDPFDQTARDERFKKTDGSGFLYAIVKVSGDSHADKLNEYRFNFGNMNHIVEDHDGELWLYVQKNAKIVTITRNGYYPVSHYDLNTTIESGKTYCMKLSAQAAKVYTQMVMFSITPADSKARVTIMREDTGQSEEVFGDIDETGGVANALEFGTYTYKVTAMNFHSSEGRFTLNSQADTHEEKVTLRRNGSNVTFSVASDADIYINGIKRGTRSWTGTLKAGNYTAECRQANHRPSQQTISVEEGKDKTIRLTPPTPITGILSITSRPLAANIKIDGKDYGSTPKNITDMLIGHHTIVINKDGYASKTEQFDISENETQRLNIALENSQAAAIPQSAAVSKTDAFQHTVTASGDKTFTVKGVTFTMKLVAGGTFTMGATSKRDDYGYHWEIPAHLVTLGNYYIGETEVTQELWEAVMGTTITQQRDKQDASLSLEGVGDNFPMYYINWHECQEFILKLNSITGQKFRLPTEAEWEYAARGGRNSKRYKYSGGNNLDKVAWHYENSGTHLHAVKTKAPNELGIYDMSGNVEEWCNDWYGSYNGNAQTNPVGPTSGSGRVVRGGEYYGGTIYCRVSARAADTPYKRGIGLGMRLALYASYEEQQNLTSHNKTDIENKASETNVILENDKTFAVGKTTFTMKPVSGGTYTMGATAEQGLDLYDSERTAHIVTLSDYYISETEVTQELWEAVMGTTITQQRDKINTSLPLGMAGRNYPMYYINWHECQEFILKLNSITGQKFRLPTEAEWEYAARGGRNSKGYKYSGGYIDDVAWYSRNSGTHLHAVKTKAPNELGIYDMSGNVWEWCQDWYGSYTSNAQLNPAGPTSGSARVIRGGNWFYGEEYCRVSFRNTSAQDDRGTNLGFRLAMSAE